MSHFVVVVVVADFFHRILNKSVSMGRDIERSAARAYSGKSKQMDEAARARFDVQLFVSASVICLFVCCLVAAVQ